MEETVFIPVQEFHKMAALVRKRCGRRSCADDVLQTVMLNCWEASLKNKSHPCMSNQKRSCTYVARAATRTIIDQWRRQQRQETYLSTLAGECKYFEATVDESYQTEEAQAIVEKLMHYASPKVQRLLRLIMEIRGSISDMAKHVNKSTKTISRWLWDGIPELRALADQIIDPSCKDGWARVTDALLLLHSTSAADGSAPPKGEAHEEDR